MSRKSRRRRWGSKQLAARATALALTGQRGTMDLLKRIVLAQALHALQRKWEGQFFWRHQHTSAKLVVQLPRKQFVALFALGTWRNVLVISWFGPLGAGETADVWGAIEMLANHYPSDHARWQCLQSIERMTASLPDPVR